MMPSLNVENCYILPCNYGVNVQIIINNFQTTRLHTFIFTVIITLIHTQYHTYAHTSSTTTTSKRNFIYKFLGILYAIRRVIKGVQYECGDKNKFKFKIG